MVYSFSSITQAGRICIPFCAIMKFFVTVQPMPYYYNFLSLHRTPGQTFYDLG